MRRKGSAAEWDRVREIAANMFDQDRPPKQIARDLGVDDQTVRAWRRKYRKGGRAALASRKPTGRPPLLGEQQRLRLAERLGELLVKTPEQCGLSGYLWTQQLIADLILREFGVSYHHDYVGVLLREMGFTHQKPARRAKEREEAKIEAWRKETWPALEKKVPSAAASS